jgi:hypothetical protein
MSYQTNLSEEDFDIAAAVYDRLEERDKDDSYKPDVSDKDTLSDRAAQRAEQRIEKERDDKRKFREDREHTIKRAVEQEHRNRQAKEVYRPKAPPLKDPDADLRDQIRNSIDFHAQPLADQQRYAADVRSMEEIQKAAKGLGLEVPKTASEIAKINELMNGQAANQATNQADDAYVQATIAHVVEPLERQAQALGTDTGTLVAHYTAADRYIRERPMEAGAEILRQGGEPDIGTYLEMARNSGVTLSSALGNYVRAEQWLERDAPSAMAWLADNYSLSEEQVIRAMRQRRWG